jgi:hypothetical protein
MKHIFFLYQRGFWYVQQARTELGKPLGLYSESALAIILLKSFGVNITWMQAVGAYICLLFIFLICGVILTRLGVVKYNAQLSNRQNPELMTIKRDVAFIKNELLNKRI